jgi:hypothetical protein
MKAIIAGGRDFVPLQIHIDWLLNIIAEQKITEIVCGMAKGADMFGYRIAKIEGLLIKEFPADWNKYGKSAGYKRNEQMADYADICILFPGGRGTMHMRNIANERKLKVIEYENNSNG